MSKLLDVFKRAPELIPDLNLSALVGPEPAEPAETPAPALPETPARVAGQPAEPVAPVVAAAPSQPTFRKVELRLLRQSPALPFDGKHWIANEQYRIVRTKLVQHPRRPKLILISSTGPADGKSITAINVAGVLSLKSEAKVLLLDCDFRRSSIHRHLGTPEGPGMAEVLAGSCSLEDAITATEYPNLFILPAGKTETNPAELLDSPQWTSTIRALRAQFGYIIVDSPPIAAVADYDLLQMTADGVVMVVRPDQSNREFCHKALGTIPKEKLIGVVMNCVPRFFFLGKNYGYGYGYY